jgi:hypothetical protein
MQSILLKSIRGSLLGKEGASHLTDKVPIEDDRSEGLFDIKKSLNGSVV